MFTTQYRYINFVKTAFSRFLDLFLCNIYKILIILYIIRNKETQRITTSNKYKMTFAFLCNIILVTKINKAIKII